jgi:PAS domain S-box-containing protein
LNAERQTIQGYLLQVQDITVRKHVEEELKEKEKRYRTLFDLSPSGIILIDTDGIIIDVNDSFCNSVLYKSDELIGNNIRSLVPAENHQLVGEHILDILSGKIFEHVVKNIKKDGTLCDMELRESSVLLPDGRKGILSAANDITERKRAEEALRESEAKFRNLADYSPNMIFINKRGKVVYANKLAEEMTGYRKDEIYSDSFNFMELIDPEYRELIMFNLKMHSEGREVPPAEYRLRTVSGKSIDSVINTKLINYEGGTAILGIVTDITERKRIEKALQLSEKQYRELFEQSPEAIYIHLDSIIVDGNPEFVKLLGASGLDELLGKSIFDILHPDYREADKSRLKVIINPGTNAPYREEKFIRLDGNIVDVEVGAAPILLKDKQAVQVLIRDITERKRAEEALQESEEKWRSITENSADHIMLLDKETNILFSNKTFPDLTLNDVVGKSAYSLIPKPFINVARNCFSNVLNTGKQDSYETEYQTKNNETKYFSVRVGPVFKSGKVVAMVSSSTDITKRKIIENSLKESYARLRSLAERLQMIREEERASVAREIHDDLGQSLTALKMDISWLQKNPDMDRAKRTEKFNTILDLTNSTIQTVKKIASDLRPGVLDDLGLISAIEWQKDEFESRYRIKCKLAINKKDIQLTEKVSIAVFRIFQETLTNIARHSEASRVDVKLDFLENKKLILEIHDNGIGIDSEIVRSPKSFGLIGMKERVNILKGTMEIIGMPSKGTLVRVIMPY